MTKQEELKLILEGISELRKEIKDKLVISKYTFRKGDENATDQEKLGFLMQRREFRDLFERLQGMYSMLGDQALEFAGSLKKEVE